MQESLTTKACSACREQKPIAAFSKDRTRADGLTYWCNDCRNLRSRKKYVRSTKPKVKGRRFVAARNGDFRQARRRIDHLINIGKLPDPNQVPCLDCGHVWAEGERRHEYDHYLGYAPEHHEAVQAVCSKCHRRRHPRMKAGVQHG